MRLSNTACDDVFWELRVVRLEDRGLGDYNYSVRNERDHSPVGVAANGGEPEHIELPAGWTVTMDASPDQFLARLTTPELVVTVDHEGRLLRSRP